MLTAELFVKVLMPIGGKMYVVGSGGCGGDGGGAMGETGGGGGGGGGGDCGKTVLTHAPKISRRVSVLILTCVQTADITLYFHRFLAERPTARNIYARNSNRYTRAMSDANWTRLDASAS